LITKHYTIQAFGESKLSSLLGSQKSDKKETNSNTHISIEGLENLSKCPIIALLSRDLILEIEIF
jgi:hypothetical protein